MRRDEALDPTISNTFVVEQANGLRRLVWNLVRDDDVVDDVLQDTFAAAVERPPRDPDRLRAWLATVAKNFVRLRIRSRTRRERRERRSARPVELPETPPAIDGDEVRGIVSETVTSLKEPYRSTLIELYYHDVSTKGLARRLKVPESTIRVRKRRALEQLRTKLDQRDPEARRAWIARALVWMGTDVDAFTRAVTSARANAPSEISLDASENAITTAAASDTGARSGAAPRSTAAILAFVLLIVLGWLLWKNDPESVTTSSHRESTSPDVAPNMSAARIAQRPTRERSSAKVGALRMTRKPSGTMIVRVIDSASGSSIANATLYVDDAVLPSHRRSDGRSATEFLMLRFCEQDLGTTDERGEIAVIPGAIRASRLLVRAPGYEEHRESERVRFGTSRVPTEYTIALEPAEPWVVRVLSEAGDPLSAIEVSIAGCNGDVQQGVTDAAGGATFLWQDRDYVVTVNEAGFVPHRQLARGPVHEARLIAGLSGEGRVVDSAGHSLAEARVRFTLRRMIVLPVERTTDADGRFNTPNLPASGVVNIEVHHPNRAPVQLQRPLPWSGETIPLPDAAWVEGQIDSGNVDDVSRVRVSLFPSDAPFLARDLASATVDRDGRFRVGPVKPGEWSLYLEHPVAMNTELSLGRLESGTTQGVTLVLTEGAAVDGHVIDTRGRPVAGVVLHVGSVFGDTLRGPHVTTDSNGAFEVHGLPVRPPVARPFKNDVRWAALADTERDARSGLVLQVCSPHQLVAKESSSIPRAVLHGSRNTCRVEPGDRGVELTIETPRLTQPFSVRLYDDETDRRVRTIANLIVVPPKSVAHRSVIFAGSSGTPVIDLDHTEWRHATIAVWTREYAVPFLRPNVDSASTPVRLEARASRHVRITNRNEEPIADCPVFVEPVLGGTSSGCAFYLGQTDGDGRLSTQMLASGTYRFRALQGDVDPEFLASATPLSTVVELDQTLSIGTLRWEPRDRGEWVLQINAEADFVLDRGN